MDLQLDAKVAVVTGASKGIGLAVVRALSAEGARVVAGARSVGGLAGIDGVTPIEVDLVEPSGSTRLVAEAVGRHGRVDILVNNVGGVALRLDGFLHVSDADFERSLQLNFFAALRATRAAVAQMIEQGGGAIVNVASVNAFFHPDGLVIDYGAAKAALLNVAKALSQELGHRASASTASLPGPWRPTCGLASTASLRRSVAPRGRTARRCASGRQPACRRAGSRHLRRSQRS